jgi:hypothetical protein
MSEGSFLWKGRGLHEELRPGSSVIAVVIVICNYYPNINLFNTHGCAPIPKRGIVLLCEISMMLDIEARLALKKIYSCKI